MTSEGIELRHATDIGTVWNTLVEIYAEVRADQLHHPHYSVERYGERLARHAAEPGWETVIGYDGDEPMGYAYVNTLQSNDRWWQRMTTPLPEDTTERSTVALKEIMLRVPLAWYRHRAPHPRRTAGGPPGGTGLAAGEPAGRGRQGQGSV